MNESETLKRSDIEHYLHPYTNLNTHPSVGPMLITRGEGVYVYDDAGNRYIEGLAGLFCASLGFSETRIMDAARRQMARLPFYHSFGHKATEPGILLAGKLIGMAPVPMSKVFFANSGSEANDTAIKLIWYYHNAIGQPRKKKIISRRRAYHGVTVASASLTGLQNNHIAFDLPISGVLHTDCPHYWKEARPGETEEVFATRCAAALERLILAEGPDTIAAFFAEPVMASGGVILPPATYFEKIQAVLRKYDVLLVADEVICGFGRTGEMFGTTTYGIEPDMISLAKQLSAGYQPISALLVNAKVSEAITLQSGTIGTFGHGFTYSGHPVAAAAALETLAIYEHDRTLDHVREVAPHFQARLMELAQHPLVGEARGVGLLGAVELVADKSTRTPFQPTAGVAAHAGQEALRYGLITRALGDTFNFCPPLIISHAQIDDMFDAAGKALDDTAKWVDATGLKA